MMKQIARFLITETYSLLKPVLCFFRPNRRGVKVVIFFRNKCLLVKNTYRDGWTFPGGGVKKNESSRQAAIREVCEEVGILVANLKNHGSFVLSSERGSRTTVFSCRVKSSSFEKDDFEIEEAMWVDIDEIPRLFMLPMATQCIRMLKLYN